MSNTPQWRDIGIERPLVGDEHHAPLVFTRVQDSERLAGVLLRVHVGLERAERLSDVVKMQPRPALELDPQVALEGLCVHPLGYE